MKEEQQSSPPSLQRIAHLPFLLQKMKSKASRNLGRKVEIDYPDTFTDTDAVRIGDNKGDDKEDNGLAQQGTSYASALLSNPKQILVENNDKDGENQDGSSRSEDKNDKNETTEPNRKKKRDSLLKQTEGPKRTDRDVFLDHAAHLENLMEEIAKEDDDASDASTLTEDSFRDEENDTTSPVNENSALLQEGTHPKTKKKKAGWGSKYLQSTWRRWKVILRPHEIRLSLKEFLQRDVCFGMLPLLVAALLLFYGLGNPELVFLPNTATLAWYLIFLVRLQVTLALARFSQFIILEVLTLRTSYMAQLTGPFVALMAMQAMGLPFLLAAWGAWNLVVLHGHHPFCRHWLGVTNLAIFTVEHNPDGDGILQSDLYGRILFAMVFVGTASSLKRTTLALFLSRRMLRNYRDQLERIMSQVRLITGVAGLAAEADQPGFDELLADATANATTTQDEDSVAMVASQVQMERTSNYMEEVPTFTTSARSSTDNDYEDLLRGDDDTETRSHKEVWEDLKLQALEKQTNNRPKAVTASERTTVFERVFESLDRYDPPSNNALKVCFIIADCIS